MKRLGLLLATSMLAAGIAYVGAQTPPPVPALPDSPRITSYSLSASTCACSVGWAIYGDGTDVDNWIDVFINGVSVSSTDSTSGWSLSSPTGSLGSIPRPITNAILTFNNPQTGTVNIVGARRPRRLSQFQEGRGVTARDLNQVITDETAMLRETWDHLNRAIVGLPGEVFPPLPPINARIGKFLAFDNSGQPIVTSTQPPPAPPLTGASTCYIPAAFGADATGVNFSDAAIASIFAMAGGSSFCIEFGGGLYKFANQIAKAMSGASSITIKGQGSKVTSLYWPSGNGISIGVGTGLNTVHFSSMALLTGTTNAGPAITVTGGGTATTNHQNTFDDISCMGFDLANGTAQSLYWNFCISTVLLSNVNIRNALVYGSSPGNNGVGITMAGLNPNYAVVANISDSSFWNTSVGFQHGAFLQGITIRNSNFTNGVTGINLPNVIGPFQLNITDSQFNTTGHQIVVGADITSVAISHNLFFVPSSMCGVVIGGGRHITISGNTFIPVAVSTLGSGTCLNASDAPGANTITGNAFGGAGDGTPLNFGNNILSNAHGWLVANNYYNNVQIPNNGTPAPGNIVEHFTNAPPTIAACGGGSVAPNSTDLFGSFSVGASTTSCILDFQHHWTTAPACLVTSMSGLPATATSSSTTQLATAYPSTPTGQFSYVCNGGP